MRVQFLGSYSHQELLLEIRRILRANADYGYRRVFKAMRLAGWKMSDNLIHRLMRRAGIHPPPPHAVVVVVGVGGDGGKAV